MTHSAKSTTSAIVMGVLTVFGSVHASTSRTDDQADIPAVKAAVDQDEAIRLAREMDLPALEKADRVVIEEAKIRRDGRRVTLADADDIKGLRKTLKPSEVPPSGGITAATLLFYRGTVLIRKVWVFEGGEWGFERPGTSWTTGREADLWEGIRKHLR
jgi:hypothetical protein